MQISVNSEAQLKINPKTALKISDALAKYSGSSRMSLALKSDLSLCTVNRVVGHLTSVGILSEKYNRSEGEAKICGHVYFGKRQILTVIDLSDYRFSVFRMNEQLDLLNRFEYSYNQSVSFYDNIEYFLRRAKHELWKNETQTDIPEYFIIIDTMNGFPDGCSLLHNEGLKAYINQTVHEIFSVGFVKITSVESAMQYSDSTGLTCGYEPLRVNYICLRENPFMCCTEKSKSIFIGPISEKGGVEPNGRFSYSMKGAVLPEFLSELMGSVCRWLSPDMTVIDSDVYVIHSELAQVIKRKLNLKFRYSSNVTVYPFKPMLYVRGAGLMLKREIILNALTQPCRK